MSMNMGLRRKSIYLNPGVLVRTARLVISIGTWCSCRGQGPKLLQLRPCLPLIIASSTAEEFTIEDSSLLLEIVTKNYKFRSMLNTGIHSFIQYEWKPLLTSLGIGYTGNEL